MKKEKLKLLREQCMKMIGQISKSLGEINDIYVLKKISDELDESYNVLMHAVLKQNAIKR